MEDPEKLPRQGTQEEDTQNRNTTKYVLDTTMCKHRHDPSHKQLEAKTNRTSPTCGFQINDCK